MFKMMQKTSIFPSDENTGHKKSSISVNVLLVQIFFDAYYKSVVVASN